MRHAQGASAPTSVAAIRQARPGGMAEPLLYEEPFGARPTRRRRARIRQTVRRAPSYPSNGSTLSVCPCSQRREGITSSGPVNRPSSVKQAASRETEPSEGTPASDRPLSDRRALRMCRVAHHVVEARVADSSPVASFRSSPRGRWSPRRRAVVQRGHRSSPGARRGLELSSASDDDGVAVTARAIAGKDDSAAYARGDRSGVRARNFHCIADPSCSLDQR